MSSFQFHADPFYPVVMPPQIDGMGGDVLIVLALLSLLTPSKFVQQDNQAWRLLMLLRLGAGKLIPV